jgi:hypothetical protein
VKLGLHKVLLGWDKNWIWVWNILAVGRFGPGFIKALANNFSLIRGFHGGGFFKEVL